jgi:hypothetical protein
MNEGLFSVSHALNLKHNDDLPFYNVGSIGHLEEHRF